MPTLRMKHYVCGFLFTENSQKVALIGKTKPKWQAGRLNGVGGKVEAGETPYMAICREFREETSCNIGGWLAFARLVMPTRTDTCEPWVVHFFKSSMPLKKGELLMATTDEIPRFYDIDSLPTNVVPNLKWLIPMALEDITGEIIQHNWIHPE